MSDIAKAKCGQETIPKNKMKHGGANRNTTTGIPSLETKIDE